MNYSVYCDLDKRLLEDIAQGPIHSCLVGVGALWMFPWGCLLGSCGKLRGAYDDLAQSGWSTGLRLAGRWAGWLAGWLAVRLSEL